LLLEAAAPAKGRAPLSILFGEASKKTLLKPYQDRPSVSRISQQIQQFQPTMTTPRNRNKTHTTTMKTNTNTNATASTTNAATADAIPNNATTTATTTKRQGTTHAQLQGTDTPIVAGNTKKGNTSTTSTNSMTTAAASTNKGPQGI
jgi:hypothetical protein